MKNERKLPCEGEIWRKKKALKRSDLMESNMKKIRRSRRKIRIGTYQKLRSQRRASPQTVSVRRLLKVSKN